MEAKVPLVKFFDMILKRNVDIALGGNGPYEIKYY